jgi:hypothetical protein
VKKDHRGEYWYVAQHDDVLCHHSGAVVTGCVTLLDGTKALPLARSVTARIGGTWHVTVIRSSNGVTQHLWTSEKGVEVSHMVSFDRSRTVCVEDRTRTPGPGRHRNGV